MTIQERITRAYCRLKKAPKLLKHRTCDGESNFCAVGALGWNAPEPAKRLEPDELTEISKILAKHIPEDWKPSVTPRYDPKTFPSLEWGQVVTYNNDPATTQADVVAVFKKAVKELKNESKSH